jgi:hypothetical protein
MSHLPYRHEAVPFQLGWQTELAGMVRAAVWGIPPQVSPETCQIAPTL